MTPTRPRIAEVLASLPDDDQVRLRWLREDLTSCLGELGAILRRVSGEQAAPPAFSITIDPPAPSDAPTPVTAESSNRAHVSAQPAPPATISWTGANGAALTYDWRTGALIREPPPG